MNPVAARTGSGAYTMMNANRRLALGLIGMLAASVGAVAFADPAPTTIYKYDNPGNLRGASCTLWDPANCGQVGHVCSGLANGYATCQKGQCGIACSSGFSFCKGACMSITSSDNSCVCRSPACIMAVIMPLLR